MSAVAYRLEPRDYVRWEYRRGEEGIIVRTPGARHRVLPNRLEYSDWVRFCLQDAPSYRAFREEGEFVDPQQAHVLSQTLAQLASAGVVDMATYRRLNRMRQADQGTHGGPALRLRRAAVEGVLLAIDLHDGLIPVQVAPRIAELMLDCAELSARVRPVEGLGSVETQAQDARASTRWMQAQYLLDVVGR